MSRSHPPPAPRRSALKRVWCSCFRLLERLRVHVLPAHFYSSVPDRGWLQRNPSLWRAPSRAPALAWDLDSQLRWLGDVCGEHLDEVAGFSFLDSIAARGLRFRYGLIEGQVLHCAVRKLAPGLIVEVGSGASTSIIADACARNAAEGRGSARIVAVDPYGPPELARLPGVSFHREPAQTVDPAVFAELGAGDLLFLDSTHVVKAGSELARLYLEVLPSLRPGVLVHIHDIYLPFTYSPWVLSDLWDWQESTLLAALISGNPSLEVLCCQSALHDARSDRLGEILPDYRPLVLDRGIEASGNRGAGGHYPSSIWLRTRG